MRDTASIWFNRVRAGAKAHCIAPRHAIELLLQPNQRAIGQPTLIDCWVASTNVSMYTWKERLGNAVAWVPKRRRKVCALFV